MSSVIVENGRYTVDPLYQWDVNQVLEIRGLSLASIPEIHFTNDAMERSIVRQATMDDAGIITVKIPNSLLQKPYTIKAYICIYEGDTFKSLYTVDVPVKARKKPTDYTLENDEEIYSFNALENLVNSALSEYEEANTKYNEANSKLETAIEKAERAEESLDSAAKAYNDANILVDQFIDNNGDIVAVLQGKANKSTVIGTILSASAWIGKMYSFEGAYPVATYDIEIALNSTATAEQAEAFNLAQIVGSATSNVVTAFGDIPTVDIPIIVKAVKK
jgi:hypothetical protein